MRKRQRGRSSSRKDKTRSPKVEQFGLFGQSPAPNDEFVDRIKSGLVAGDSEEGEAAGVRPLFTAKEIRAHEGVAFDKDSEEDRHDFLKQVRAAQSGDESAMAMILTRTEGLFHFYARRFFSKTYQGGNEIVQEADREDLLSRLRGAMVKTIQRVDPDQGWHAIMGYFQRTALSEGLNPLLEKTFGLREDHMYQRRDLAQAQRELKEELGLEVTPFSLQVAGRLCSRQAAHRAFRKRARDLAGELDLDTGSDDGALTEAVFEGGVRAAREDVMSTVRQYHKKHLRKTDLSETEFFQHRAQRAAAYELAIDEFGGAERAISEVEAARLWAMDQSTGASLEDKVRRINADYEPGKSIEGELILEHAKMEVDKLAKLGERKDPATWLLEEMRLAQGKRRVGELLQRYSLHPNALNYFLLSESIRNRLETGEDVEPEEVLAEYAAKGRFPSTDKIYALLGVNRNPISLDQPIGDDDGGSTVGERIVGSTDVEDEVVTSAFARKAMQLVHHAQEDVLPSHGGVGVDFLDLYTGHGDAARGMPPMPLRPVELSALYGVSMPTVFARLEEASALSEGTQVIKGVVGTSRLETGEEYRDRRDISAAVSPERRGQKDGIRRSLK